MEEALRRAVAARRAETIGRAGALIRVPTLNPPGDRYREICELIAGWLEPMGFDCAFIRAEGTPGDGARHPRWNLLARREGTGAGPCVHFNGHVDVVEVGRGWTRDPFGGELVDGRIYGRGACDMKGGIAAAITAVAAFLAVRPDAPGAIEISATADEETGGYGGVAYLAERGVFARVDHVIIPEPLNKERICLGHRGVWWAELETLGRIAHGSMPFLGDCAIRHMGAVLAEMEESLYPALAARRTAMPVVPEPARASTLNVNSIHGGQAEPEPGFDGLPSPVVADSCRMMIDRRFLAEEELGAVKAEFRAAVERARARRPFDYRLRDVLEVRPSMTDRDGPVARALAEGIRAVLGREPDYVVSPGSYDQKHIDRIGRLRDCVAYGPGRLDLAHQPDEYVEVEDMLESALVMALALGRLLGPGDEVGGARRG
ncbi:acetylornithine deacetylase/succinyl-diaminopimelate desuccinylase family protein [Amaricoccus solimangrovi]|uniref:Probable succinyl-diaminopimelate desuccinylase n=1 Tax=Amaricoccus solimangrovi TaxID=2589815 RepID=A0A501WZ84_9RHOB|nr:acetylornithine deacetylase/succinyl-diaminopimelate desuccinylase family protein [Amaricoccus solimangrovi]TPE53645.1 acetylornithine deacetylase/succinyl-diaminopimelate desuccinylase family protein [Amaricoccus solimangrovi]